MSKQLPSPIDGNLRKFQLRVPEVIRKCSGIVVFGKRIKSLVVCVSSKMSMPMPLLRFIRSRRSR